MSGECFCTALYGISPKEIWAACIPIFTSMNVLGILGAVNALQEKTGPLNLRKILFASSAIMITFLLGGFSILQALGISHSAFSLAGALIIGIIGLELILGVSFFQADISNPDTASVVPVAFPMLAGTGTIATILSIKPLYSTINILLAILLNIAYTGIVIRQSTRIQGWLGKSGMGIISKLMGLILLAMAIQVLKNNLLA